MNRDAALLTAIQAAGGTAKLATKIGVLSQAVSQWKRVPPRRVIAVEKASGIPRHVLRPDLYPPAEAA